MTAATRLTPVFRPIATQTPKLYLRKGTAKDDEEGFRWLNRAYGAPDRNLEAGAYVGDCYLNGKGTKQDVQKAEEIVMPLANQNVVPAMTVAGQIAAYKAQQSIPAARRDELYRQARQWWEGAAEKGDWNASAYLGQQYELGIGGVERNEEEAEQRYKAGASHGNPLSLFFSGLFLEKKPERQFRKLPHYRFTLIRPVPKFCWTVNLRRCPQTPLLVSHLEPIG